VGFGRRATLPHWAGHAQWNRVLVALACLAILVGLLPVTASARSSAPGSATIQALGAQRQTGGSAAAIPYQYPADTAASGPIAGAADPSIHRRPVLKSPIAPKVKTADQTQWSANRRVYANPDGTFTAQIGRAINFKDASGLWTPIDLTLSADDATNFHPTATPAHLKLSSSAGDAGFATLTGQDGVVTLKTLGYGAGGRTGNQLMFRGHASSPDVFVQPTDLGFEFGAIFSNPSVDPRTTFVLDPGTLGVALGLDGLTVQITSGADSSGQAIVVGSISAPIVLDGQEVPAGPSTVTASLVARGDGTYLLTYSLSASWLQASDRVFPVMIDPTACIRYGGGTSCTVNKSSTNYLDTYIANGLPNSYPTTPTWNRVGWDVIGSPDAVWNQMRSLVYFDGATLPDGAMVTAATLGLVEDVNRSGAQVADLEARMITAGWGSTSTWNQMNAAVNSAYDSPTYHPCSTGSTDCTVNIDVTKAARSWYTRRAADWKPNIGFQIRYATEGSTSNYYETDFYNMFASVGNRPQLTLTYEVPAVQFDFDPALGPTYAPSSMIAGQATILPISITNNSSFTFDATNYRVGWRFFDVKGNLVGAAGVATIPAIPSGTTSAVFGLSLTPPSLGQFTLRLDLAKVVSGTNMFASDWATPSLYYSRDKKILTSDSTRWVGSSVIERDEFGITVSNGQGTGPDAKALALGSLGRASIDLSSHNLSFASDSGLSVADRLPLTLSYGYNSKAAAGCTGYLGILGACGWFTNYDERIVAGSSDGAYDYYGSDGNVYRTDTDYDGQLVGAPVQIIRDRITLFDENRPTSGGATMVTAASAGLPTVSGPNVIAVPANTTTVLNGFLDGGSGREISLNAYRVLDWYMRSNTATPNYELCVQLDDKTTGATGWFCMYPSADWDTSHQRISLNSWCGQTCWSRFTLDLWAAASGTIGSYSTLGAKTDQYYIKSFEVIGSSSNTGTIWLDAMNMYPSSAGSGDMGLPYDPGGSATSVNSTGTAGLDGGVMVTSPTSCSGACVVPVSPVSNGFFHPIVLAGSSKYFPDGSLDADPYVSWWWRKDGGTDAAMTFCLTDQRTGTSGELTYFAGPAVPTAVKDCAGLGAADRHLVQVSQTLPGVGGTTTRVIRDLLNDAQQVLNFYKDDAVGSSSASPPTAGPTPDAVKLTGFTLDPIDGSDMIISTLGLNSIGAAYKEHWTDRYQGNGSAWGFDTLNYYLPITHDPWYLDDFSAAYPDGTTHWFNRDGLLTRITTKDGAELDLGWTYGAGTGQSNYTLTAIHAPTDNTMDQPGGTRQYQHRLTITKTPITGFNQITFQETLGTVSAPVTGRRADFEVATTTGTTWGVGDLVKVGPARHVPPVLPAAACGTHPSGCEEFDYTSTTSHLLSHVSDPRWDGSTTGANDYRFEVGWSGSDPVSISDRSHGNTPDLRILTFDRGRSASPLYVRPLWQDAAAMAAATPANGNVQYAIHEDLSPDGRALTTYVRQACATSDCSISANWPAADNATLAPRVASTSYFDGLSQVTRTTSFRCPGVAVGGCTGTAPLVSVSRQATNSSAKVDNYSNALAAGLTAWTQTPDQYFASIRDSAGANEDLYRTEYTYDAANNEVLIESPEFNRVTDYAGLAKTRDGLRGYYRMNDAGATMTDASGGNRNGTYTGSPTMQVAGSLVRDAANKAVTFNGTNQYGSVTGAALGTITGSFTVETWVKSTSTTATQAFIGSRNAAFGFDAKLCNDSSCSSKQNVRVEVGDGAQWLVQGNIPFAWKAGRWYDIAVEVDAAAGSALIFVDGDPLGRLPFTVAGTPVLTDGSHNLYLGTNGAGSEFFSGSIDETSIYTTALDASEIRASNEAGTGLAISRVENIYHQNPSTAGTGADLSQQSAQYAVNGDFDNGLWAWNAAHGAQWIHWDTNTSPLPVYTTGLSGTEDLGALRINGSAYADQLVQLVPGQRIHFQVAGVTSGGAARATYRVDYWKVSTGTWQPLVPENSFTATAWSVAAYEYTIPVADTSGLLKITLRNNGATGDAGFDDLLLVTSWQAWTYLYNVIDLSPTGTSNAWMMEGLPATKSMLSPTGDSSIRTDQLTYAADDAHQGIFPTRVVANYVDGIVGPNPDQDVISTTTYDAWGRPLTTTDPDGVTKTSVYDGANKTDLVQTYDNLYNPPLVPATTMTYDLAGNLTATLTPQGRLTSSTYDLLNHTLTTTAPDGTVQRTDHDNYGRVSASWANYLAGVTSSDHDVLTTYSYDAYGRVTQQDVECGQLACTSGLDARTTTTYDLLGDKVASIVYSGAAGSGTPRVTTNWFETTGTAPVLSRTSPSGQTLPIAPSAAPAPLCPGSTTTRCNTASIWTWNGVVQSGTDMNGRTYASTDAYGVISLTDSDLAGQAVQTIADYTTTADDGLNDQNVTAQTQYNVAGAPILTAKLVDSAGHSRTDVNTYDALGRALTVTRYGTDGNSFGSLTKTYTFGGRVSTSNDGASTTKTIYDPAMHAVRTIANYDTAGNAGMTLDAFETGTDGWSSASSGFFTTSPATAIGLDEDSQGNQYTTVAPVSGRGRLGLTTHATNTVDGAWLDLSPATQPVTYQSGHVYKVAFDVVGAQAGTALRAFLGQDASGGSYAELGGGIATTTSWQRLTFSWTPSTSLSSNVHFAVRKDTAGQAIVYLDNVVVWDATDAATLQKNIVSSETAYDADGLPIGSVLPPGDPANDEPLVTTVAPDIAGRTLATVVNGASGSYAAAVQGTSGLASYASLDEPFGTAPLDQHTAGSLTNIGGVLLGVAGGIDEPRTAGRFIGGYLYQNANITSSTGNVAMEAWVRADTAPGGANTVIVASNGDTSNSWGLGVTPAGEAAGFAQKSSNPNSGFWTIAATGVTVTDGKWHQMVLSRDATTWTLTVDGTARTVTNSTKDPGTLGAKYTIGAWADGSRAFNGDIDEVSVYTANIGTSAASAHYAAGHKTDTVTALTTRTNYDGLGRPTDVWAPDGVRTHTVYDRLGNRTETWANYKDGSTSGSTGDDDIRSIFAYDVLGELTGYCPAKQVQAGGCDPTSSSNAQAWHYTFDQMGRQTVSVPPVNQSAAVLNTSETVFDTGGRIAKTCTYPAGQSCTSTTNTRHTDLTYDGLGRVLSSKVYDRSTGSDVLKFTKAPTWNLDSTPATIAESGDTLSYFYDPAGRLQTFKRGSTTLTTYAYNAATGTLASRTDGTIGTTTFGTYDWANRNIAMTTPTSFGSGTITRTFRLDGSVATQAFPNSVTETVSYDPAKRPTRIDMGTTGYLTQTMDRAGRVITEGRSLTGITGDPGTGLQSFSYDGASRVSGSTGLGTTHSYTYDLDGNRLTRVDGPITTSFTYDRTDELINQTISGTTKGFVYDAFGNMTSSADSASTLTTMAYDEANRLKSITPPSSPATTFTLDALGRNMTRATNGTTTDSYAYLGTTETAYETGNATTDAVYDAAGARVAIKTGSTVSYVIFDLHGSVAALCPSGSTSLTDAYRYDPWGQVSSYGTAINPWRYRGLLDVSPDATNRLYDMGARYYSPGLGTFTTEDSVAGKAADPMSMNRFLYAEADPATLIDPDGHAIIGGVCGGDYDFCITGSGQRIINPRSGYYDSAYSSLHQNFIRQQAMRSRRVGPRGHDDSQNSSPRFVNPWALKADPKFQALMSQAQAGCGLSGRPNQAACELLRALREGEDANRAGFCSANAEVCKQADQADRDLTQANLGITLDTFFLVLDVFDPPGEAVGVGVEGVELEARAGAEGRLQEAIGEGTAEGGYSSFSAAKSALGPAEEGWVYDHVVEQCQLNGCRSGFAAEQVHNPENLNMVLREVNQTKANYYSSIQPFTGGSTVRDWLNGQSFAVQWAFGMGVTEDIWNGVIQ